MQKSQVKAHFGTLDAIGAAVGCTKSAVSQWPELVPELWAYKIHVITAGAIPLERELYDRQLAAAVDP